VHTEWVSDDDEGSAVADQLEPEIADSSGYRVRQRDLEFLGLTRSEIEAWRSRTRPLGLSDIQYRALVVGLAAALKRDGISTDDCDVRLKGSASQLFSGAHKPMPITTDAIFDLFREEHERIPDAWELDEIAHRLHTSWIRDDKYPSRRPFDSMYRLSISRERSDIDLQLSSDILTKRCEDALVERGRSVTEARLKHPVYNFVKRDLVDDVLPNLYRFSLRMTDSIGRHVGIAVFPSAGPPDVSATKPELSAHLTSDDWILRLEPAIEREPRS
jgi:hypothetical protein